MSKQIPKWKRFENLVAQVQKDLSPHAEVLVNQKIIGKRTNRPRQVDIVVKQKVAQFDILIVIDCKDHADPIDVKDVEEFIGLVDDVGANKGVIVSARGFTNTAKTRAQGCGIDVYMLGDAESHDWQTYASIPVVCDFRAIGRTQCQFFGAASTTEWASLQDPQHLIIFDSNHRPQGTLGELLVKKWNEHKFPFDASIYREVKIANGQTFVTKDGKQYEEVEVSVDIHVLQNLYLGQVGVKELKSFQNQVTGDTHSIMLTADAIDTSEVERSWLRINSIEDLAVKPLLTLRAWNHYAMPD